MNTWYEHIQYQKGMPVKGLLVGIKHHRYHWHDGIEIILVLEGTINVAVEERSYNLKKGDMLLINSWSFHRIDTADKDNILLVLQINPDFFKDYYEDFTRIRIKFDSYTQKEGKGQDFLFIRDCTARIALEYRERKTGYQIAVVAILNTMIAFMLRHYPHTLQNKASMRFKTQDMERINRILSYVNLNYTSKININDMSQKEYLSPYHFSRYIKSKLGITLQEYIMARRLERGQYMLLRTEEKLSIIAEKCGFPDAKSFTRQFKKYFGFTPSDYRKSKIGDNMSFEDSVRETYLYDDEISGNLLQTLDDDMGYAYNKLGVPIDWASLGNILEEF